ncbi:MAG TPA: GGDEF domain-containing protein [Eggerthellaceae bacterium]|nr:GGDEF domain-containing protein [Eggerthellaceae bacterium]
METAAAANPINIASFSFGTILVCLTCLVYMVLHRRFMRRQSKLFVVVVVVLIVNAVTSMVAEVMKANILTDATAAVCVPVANYLYFISHTAMAPLLCLYFLAVCGSSERGHRLENFLYALPFYVAEVLVLINPLMNWVYYYDANMAFTRNWAMYYLYAVAAFYLLFGLSKLMRSWHALTTIRRRALLYFFSMAAAGIVVQLLVPTVRLELFAESIGLLGIMLFVESEEDLIDFECGVHNRAALQMNLDMGTSRGDPFYAIVVRIRNVGKLTSIGGLSLLTQFVSVAISDYLKSITPWHCVYRVAPTRFVLTDPSWTQSEAEELAGRIAKRFERSWSYRGIEVNLNAVMALACIPDDLPATDDVFYLVDAPMAAPADGGIVRGDALGYVKRRLEVERAVQSGLTEGNYEVYYQPLFDAQGKPYAAEALMRLHDDVLGDVPPFEFIEVAERLGVIEDIGDFALSEVCSFMASGMPRRLGIGHISVNLSVIQCMQADFAEHVGQVVREHGVDPSCIAFEITESVAAGDYEFLRDVMHRLHAEGHRFAMDDYGTGYSNMHSFLALDFDIVKIDKSVLWDAEKSDSGKAILENSVTMLHTVGCSVLVEGVETEAQAELLRRVGVDYYQGYLFSRPLPKDDFIAFLSR